MEKTEAAAPAESEEPKAEQQAADEAPVVEDVKEDDDDDDEDDDDDDEADDGTMFNFYHVEIDWPLFVDFVSTPPSGIFSGLLALTAACYSVNCFTV